MERGEFLVTLKMLGIEFAEVANGIMVTIDHDMYKVKLLKRMVENNNIDYFFIHQANGKEKKEVAESITDMFVKFSEVEEIECLLLNINEY